MDPKLLGEVFVTVLVILDPPGMIPMFLALTGALPPRDRNHAAAEAVALAAGVIVVFAVGGQQILRYLGISLPALQGAGGLLLLLVALEMLTGQADDPARPATANVALVPLGTPLLAGPGAIVATMLFVQRVSDAGGPAAQWRGYGAIALGITLALGAVWLTLRFCAPIVRVIRPAGVEVLTRIAGLLLAAIAVQLVADAVAAFAGAYGGPVP